VQGPAVLRSLIASAQRHEIDLQLYLRSVLAYLPALPPEELQNNLPDVWKRDLVAEQQAKLSAHHAAVAQAVIRQGMWLSERLPNNCSTLERNTIFESLGKIQILSPTH
jgi:hypothetical protein